MYKLKVGIFQAKNSLDTAKNTAQPPQSSKGFWVIVVQSILLNVHNFKPHIGSKMQAATNDTRDLSRLGCFLN